MAIVHHHLIIQCKVNIIPDSLKEEDLRKFMEELLEVIDMKALIKPQAKLSHQKAWTGVMGIITSHMAFHYWVDEQYLQLDIYSCKNFDKNKAINFIKKFWKAKDGRVLFINREVGKDFDIEKINFD